MHKIDTFQEFLFLPLGQNEALTANLTLEPMFRKYERGGEFKHIFNYKNQVVRLTRDLRVAQVCPPVICPYNDMFTCRGPSSW